MVETTSVKSKWRSKTLWANLVVGIVSFFPKVAEVVTPSQVAQFLVLLNIVLRFATKDKIYLVE